MKLVVVDDEIRQCTGLKNILKRYSKEMEVEVFTSAEQALRYIEKEKVRIIITDICMPQTDGLELTDRIKKMDDGAKVILLTGYAEFEYARKAIALGAFDYLLKPLNPVKLNEVLERAKAELLEKELLEEQQKKMQKKLDMTLPVYMESLLNQWIYGRTSEQENMEIEKIIPKGESGFVIVTRLSGMNEMCSKLEKQQVSEIKRQIIWWMRKKIQRPWHCLSFWGNIFPDTMVSVIVRDGNTGGIRTEYDRMVSRLRWEKTISLNIDDEQTETLETIIAIGGLYKELLENIVRAYAQSVEALEYRFYFPEKNVLYAESIGRNKEARVTVSLAEEALLCEALKEGDTETAFENLRTILERFFVNGYPDPKKIQNCMENLMKHVALSLNIEPEFRYEPENPGNNMKYLMNAVKDYMSLTVQQRENGRKERFYTRFFAYLNEHYQEDISLDDLSEYFSLTPAYCSALIKETAGENFSKLLIELRIKKARELLQNTEQKIYEIASDVGYKDVKYFNRVFKRETGITPVQYREEIQKIRIQRRSGSNKVK